MLKITDSQYELWSYIPLEYIRALHSGKSVPLLLRCLCQQNHQKDEIVVKLSGQVMSDDAKCRELLAAFIANELGIHVAEPVLVYLGQDSLLIFQENNLKQRARQAQGKNFGNKWAGDGYNEFVSGFSLHPDLVLKALHIFIFDVLIVNADRRFEKQNLKTYQNDIVIFDHEAGFGFLFDILPNPTPWLFTDHDKQWMCNHLFYQELKRNYAIFDLDTNIDNFISVLVNINPAFWTKAKSLVPAEWQQGHEQISKIEQHFALVNSNHSQYSQALKQLFS
ncbi:MAG TPA: hypothetical protein DCM08_02175 [Microscillaceae bacterium]|jgi:hypothetical protein|nr:hypothetical protein [Microscillaceae bacterium]